MARVVQGFGGDTKNVWPVQCIVNAKSNPNLHPWPIADPDYFNIKGKQWLVIVDR